MLTKLLAICLATSLASASSSSSRLPLYPRQATNGIKGTGDVALQISTKGSGRNATAPLLYGWMIEDISHSIEGGLYGELVMNRAFQGSDSVTGSITGFSGTFITSSPNLVVPGGPSPYGYQPIGGTHLMLDNLHPLSDALPIVMRVDIPTNATGEVGFLNEGWWGMQVTPQTYNASFYILPYGSGGGYAKYGDYSNLTAINVSLRSNLTGQVFATQKIPVGNLSSVDYTQLSGQIMNTAMAPNSNNSFAITMDAAEVAGGTFYFSFISLFGETFKDRPNGMRKDLAQHVYDLRPKILRFPGGNNIEGQTIATRFKWNETIGPLIDRPGRPGDWGYYNTDGFGLLEFLYWTEDMEIEPVLAVYAGYSLDGTSYPEDRMAEVLQSALDELEYCMGDTSTKYGALRARDGHPDPFSIKYVELGNEDFFSATYPYRFPILYNGIKAAYPDITLISTAYDEAATSFNYTTDLPAGSMWDTHHYTDPTYYRDSFDFYDNWQETTDNSNVTIFIGEYSVFQLDTPSHFINFSDPADVHVFYPNMIAATGEAVYLLASERNPNVVKMSAYAPSLANLNSYAWTPNMVTFTANPNETILSASYYSQRMLNMYRGTENLPVSNTKGDFDPLYWVASIDTPSNAVYLKVVNAGNTTVPLSVDMDTTYSSLNGTILTNENPHGINYLSNLTAIVPKPIEGLRSGSPDGSAFQWSVPAYSISVLQFDL